MTEKQLDSLDQYVSFEILRVLAGADGINREINKQAISDLAGIGRRICDIVQTVERIRDRRS